MSHHCLNKKSLTWNHRNEYRLAFRLFTIWGTRRRILFENAKRQYSVNKTLVIRIKTFYFLKKYCWLFLASCLLCCCYLQTETDITGSWQLFVQGEVLICLFSPTCEALDNVNIVHRVHCGFPVIPNIPKKNKIYLYYIM